LARRKVERACAKGGPCCKERKKTYLPGAYLSIKGKAHVVDRRIDFEFPKNALRKKQREEKGEARAKNGWRRAKLRQTKRISTPG